MMEIDRAIQKQMTKLYKRAEKITNQENITEKDMEELNSIASVLIENCDYFDLVLFNRLSYNNDILRAKVDAAIHEFRIVLEVFYDFVNFDSRGKLDDLKKFYEESGMVEHSKELAEMTGDKSRR